MSKRLLTLTVNERVGKQAVADNALLVDVLRDTLGLTGTKQGCDGGECGACTVLVDDQPQLACITLAASCEGRRIETIEQLATHGRMSRLQQAFHEKLGTQCGFCTPGMIMAAEALLRRYPEPERGADPRGAGRQPVPLHRLREDHRIGAGRRRSRAMSAAERGERHGSPSHAGATCRPSAQSANARR